MEYKRLIVSDINTDLFSGFIRRQEVNECVRVEHGVRSTVLNPFIDDWSAGDYSFLVQCLQNTASSGGLVLGAFDNGVLKGFASAEAKLIGSKSNYIDLSSLHVSHDMRGRGIGRHLFEAVKAWAAELGAEKLYISSHSAAETQAFYMAMGCREAAWYNPEHIKAEPFDCQLECPLGIISSSPGDS